MIKPKETLVASLHKFCLSDFYIIQKWIDYAKGIGDQSIETFNDRPIIFKDIYEMAKKPKYSYFTEYDNHMMKYDENLVLALKSFLKKLN